jgi:hypothetical protein
MGGTTVKTTLKTTVLAVMALFAMVLFSTCELFSVGLGSKVDLEPPVVQILAPEVNAYISSILEISGTASDDIGIASLRILIDRGGQLAPIVRDIPVSSSGRWEASFDIARSASITSDAVPNGQRTIQIIARDAKGNESRQSITVYLDSIEPTVLVKVPASFDPNNDKSVVTNTYITIKGEAWDATGIKAVDVSILDVDGNVVATKLAEGTTSWNTRFVLGEDVVLTDLTYYYFSVIATDLAENRNTRFFHDNAIWDSMTGTSFFPVIDAIGRLDQLGTPIDGVDPGFLTTDELEEIAFYVDINTDKPVITFTNIDADNDVLNNVVPAQVPIMGFILDDKEGIDIRFMNDESATATIKASVVNLETGIEILTDLKPVRAITPSTDGFFVNFEFALLENGEPISNGRYRITVSAVDKGGTRGSTTADFIIDSTRPVISNISPAYLSPPAVSYVTLNQAGKVEVSADITDDNPLPSDHVPYIELLNDIGTVITGPVQMAKGEGDNWTGQVQPVPGAPAARIRIVATDSSGKTSSVTMTYSIDTEAPMLTVDSPVVDAVVDGTALGAFGTASDGTGSGIHYVRWYMTADPDNTAVAPAADSADWSDAALSLSGITTNWSISATFPGGIEGAFTLFVKALDYAENESVIHRVPFNYDRSIPVITNFFLNDGSFATGNNFKNEAFTFGVDAADTNGLASISVKEIRDGDSETMIAEADTLSGIAGTWTYNKEVSADGSNDGNYEYEVTILDIAGRPSITWRRTVTIDTQSPVLEVISPSPGSYEDRSTITIAGTVSDGIGKGLSSLEWSLDQTTWTAIPVTSSMYRWSANIDITAGGQGPKILYVRASDGLNPVVTESVDFNYDLAPPALGATITLTGGNDSAYVSSGFFSLSGSASDSYSLKSIEVEERKGNDPYGDPIQTLIVTGTEASWQFDKNHATNGSADGTYEYRFTAIDAANRRSQSRTTTVIIDTTKPTVTIDALAAYVMGPSLTVSGTASDANVVSKLQYRTDEGSWIDLPGASTWFVNLDLDTDGPGIDTGLSEGLHTIEIRAVDAAGLTGDAASTSFTVDQFYPVLTETSAPTSGYQRTSFSLGGTASDTVGLKSITITENNSPVTGITMGSGLWSKGNLPLDGVVDGTYVYNIILTDLADKPVTLQRTVTIDTQAPDLTLSAPTAGSYLSGTAYQVRGTSKDVGPAGVASVEYRIDVNGNDSFADPVDIPWTQASLTGENWLAAISLNDIGLGLNKRIEVRARDNAGNEVTLVPSTFHVDQAIPTATVKAGTDLELDSTFRNSSYTFTLSLADDVDLSSLTVTESKDGASVNLADNFPLTGITSEWSHTKTVAENGANDGIYVYEARVRDAAGKESVILRRTVTVDATPPAVTISNIAPLVGLNTVNETINFSVSAVDVTSGLEGVRWDLLPDGVSAPDYASTRNSFSAPPYASFIDTTKYDDLSAYKLWVVARDKTGNEQSQYFLLNVDQSSDLPQADFTDLDDSVTTVDGVGVLGVNVLDINARIRGTLTDDDSVDSASVRIRINSTHEDDWKNLSGPVGTSGRSVNFNHSISDLPDGLHYFYLRFSDLPSAKEGLEAVTTTVGPIHFAVDTATPVVAVTSPAGNSYFFEEFTINGDASDDNGLTKADLGSGPTEFVEVKLASETWTSALKRPVDGDGRWSYILTGAKFDSLAEGANAINVRATDRFGKTFTATYSFVVDTQAPTVVIEAPTAMQWHLGASATMRGSASDVAGNPLSQVRFWVGKTTGSLEEITPPVDMADWTLASGTDGWSGSINLIDLGEGRKTLHVRAQDRAGLWSPVATRNFGVDQNDPLVTETEVGTSSAGRNDRFSLGGKLTDSNELLSVVVTQKRGEGDVLEIFRDETLTDRYTEGDNESFDWTLGDLPRDPLAADPSLPSAHFMGDGVYNYVITLYDATGVKSHTVNRQIRIDMVGPTATIMSPTNGSSVQGTALLINGSAQDNGDVSPIQQVRYWVGTFGAVPPGVDDPNPGSLDYAKIGSQWQQATGGSSWSATLDFVALLGAGVEGALSLHVIAQDTAGNWGDAVVTHDFTLDQNAPTITGFAFGANQINTVGGSNYAKADFNFGFTLNDTNSLKSYTISRDGTALAGHNAVAITAGTKTLTIGSVSQTVGGGGLADGTYEYVVTVYDIADKERTFTFLVVVDSSDPALAFNTFAPSILIDDGLGGYDEYVNGLLRFTASAGDENGLQEVRWWFVEDGVGDIPTEGSFATGTPKAAPYTVTIDTRPSAGVTDDAYHTVYLGAKDRAGNISFIERRVYVNQASDAPVITLTNIDPSVTALVNAATNLLESNAKVQGSVSDDDWVNRDLIEISLNGGTWAQITNRGLAGTTITFEYPLTALDDGPHYLQLRAADTNDGTNNRKLGLSAVIGYSPVIYFVIDKSNPVVIINTPSSIYVKGPITLTGTVEDGNAMSQVLVSRDGGSTYIATDVSIFTPGTGLRSWAWDGNLSDKPEGPFTVKVKGIDEFGKESVADITVTVDATGPRMSIASPRANDQLNGFVEITGTAIESFGMEEVWLALVNRGETPLEGNWVLPAEGTFAWTYELDTTGKDDGLYDIWVRGLDSAGNTSVYNADPALSQIAIRPIEIFQASDKPDITLNSLSLDGSYKENLLPTSREILGSVRDDDNVKANSVYIRIATGGDLSFDDPGSTIVKEWTLVTSGNPLARFVNWTHKISSDPLDPTYLPDGEYRFEIRASDEAFNGNYETDTFKWDLLGPVKFAIDSQDPVLEITSPAQGSFLRGVGASNIITITGKASDENDIATVMISINEGPEVGATDTSGDGSFSTWSYAYVPAVGLIGEGEVDYRVTVTDKYGRTSLADRYFVVDRIAPLPVLTQPDSGAEVYGAITIRGETTETNNVQKVYLWIGTDLASAPGNPTSVPGDPANSDWTGWIPLTGSFSWTYDLDTRTIGAGSNVIVVRAYDRAGNLSDAMVRPIVVNQTKNLPTITVTNLNNTAATLFGTGGEITGTVSDAEGVDLASLEISIDNGITWTKVTNPGSTWRHKVDGDAVAEPPIAAIADSAAAYQVRVRVQDNGKTLGAITIPKQEAVYPPLVADPLLLAVDRALPTVSVHSITLFDRYEPNPLRTIGTGGTGSVENALLNNNFTIHLAASDTNGIISEVMFSLDSSAYTATGISYNAGTGRYELVVPVDVSGSSNDGSRKYTFRVKDAWGQINTVSLDLRIDTFLPTVSFLDLADYDHVNGSSVTVRGSTFDASGVASVTITGGRNNAPTSPVSLTRSGTLTTWSTTFDSTLYDNAAYTTVSTYDFRGKTVNRYLFPLTVVATDAAGNRSGGWADGLGTVLNLYIAPEEDKPYFITETVMPADGSSVSGTIVLQSTVVDDDRPAYVLIYADLDGDGIYSDTDLDYSSGPFLAPLASPAPGEAGYPAYPASPVYPDDYTSNVLRMNISNGVWTALVNQNSEFEPAALLARYGISSDGFVGFKLVPYDINGIMGDAYETSVFIDALAPEIKDLVLTIDGEPLASVDNQLVRGTVTLSGTIVDDAEIPLSSILISYAGGLSGSFNTLAVTGPVVSGNLYQYSFTVDLDTTAFFAANKYGELSIVIRATDRTFKQTNKNFSLLVDNRPPTLSWNGSTTRFFGGYNAFTMTATEEGDYYLVGKANDLGSDIAHVDVYFVKDLMLYSPRRDSAGNKFAPSPAVNATEADQLYTADGLTLINAGNAIPFTDDEDWVIRIDNRFELGNDQGELGDKDGFLEGLRKRSDHTEWSVFFDSMVFLDGPIQIHFVAYDTIGNRSHTSITGIIANNPPAITRISNLSNVTIIDDATGSERINGVANLRIHATDEEGIDVTGFGLSIIEKRSVSVTQPLVPTAGLKDLSFVDKVYGIGSFFNVTPDSTPEPKVASADISIDPDTQDLLLETWYKFRAVALDTDGANVYRDFWLRFKDNNYRPIIIISADPFSAGSGGHYEPVHTTYNPDRPAVSGKVRISGQVKDDSAIPPDVFLKIDTDDTYGRPAVVDGDSGITNDQGETYIFNWYYDWDTDDASTGINTVAKTDVVILVVGYDSQLGVPEEIRVDVVPYITTILTGNDSGLYAFLKRSALGKFVLGPSSPSTPTFQIQGYNLNPASGTNGDVLIGAKNGITGYAANVSETTRVTVGGISYRRVTVSRDIPMSDYIANGGYVTVKTNGISSRNNTNDPVLDQNKEPTLYNQLLSDDREIALWSVNSRTDLVNMSEAVMRPNFGNTGVDWLYTKAGNELAFTNNLLNGSASLTSGFSIKAGDFAYNTAGRIFWIFLHNAQWLDNAYSYFGSVQWGQEVGAYNFPKAYDWHTWNQSTEAKLGLGNLSHHPLDGTNPPIANFLRRTDDYLLSRYYDMRLMVKGDNSTSRQYVAYRDVSTTEQGVIFYGFMVGTGLAPTNQTTALNTLASPNAYFANLAKQANRSNGAWVLTGNAGTVATGLGTPLAGRTKITTDRATYYDVGLTNAGVAVAVWFDDDSGALKLAYNLRPELDRSRAAELQLPAAWVTRTFSFGSSGNAYQDLESNAGSHVKMQIDALNGIHLTYQDTTTGYLKYAYLPNYLSDGNDVRRVFVDGFFSTGQHNGMSIREFGPGDYRPVISSFAPTFAGSKASIRVAWPTASFTTSGDSGNLLDGADINLATPRYTGKWEVMMVPSLARPSATKTFIETLDTSRITVGYNGTYLEEATYLGVME